MSKLGPDSHNAWHKEEDYVDLARQKRPTKLVTIETDTHPVCVDLGATALVVIDMQNLFCEDDAAPGRQMIDPLSKMISTLRDTGVPIVWLNWGNRPDQANLPPSVRYAFNRNRLDQPQPFLTKGEHESEIIKELSVEEGDIHVDKYRLSGFWDTPLDSIFRGRKVDTLLFTGVNLDQCVYHTLADASFVGYDCVLVSDCCATTSPDFCTEATLYNVRHGMGFVSDSEAVLESLKTARAS